MQVPLSPGWTGSRDVCLPTVGRLVCGATWSLHRKLVVFLSNLQLSNLGVGKVLEGKPLGKLLKTDR